MTADQLLKEGRLQVTEVQQGGHRQPDGKAGHGGQGQPVEEGGAQDAELRGRVGHHEVLRRGVLDPAAPAGRRLPHPPPRVGAAEQGAAARHLGRAAREDHLREANTRLALVTFLNHFNCF